MDPTMDPRNEEGNTNSSEVVHPVNRFPWSTRCKVDPDHVFDLVGIVATVLNLLLVVFIYLYTPV